MLRSSVLKTAIFEIPGAKFLCFLQSDAKTRCSENRPHSLSWSPQGFPLAHETRVGITQEVQTVRRIVGTIAKRFGTSQRVWVMDRGMISKDTLAFLAEPGRHYLLATRRDEMKHFQGDVMPGPIDDVIGNTEAVAAFVHDPHRFGHAKAIGRYFGLVPCQDQSGDKNRLGHITREGSPVVGERDPCDGDDEKINSEND